MIWRFRAAFYLWRKYKFDWEDARELAYILYHNDDCGLYNPKEVVDEEMSYWGE